MMSPPLPPLAFSVSNGFLNVFQSGALYGVVPILAIPDYTNFMFLPEEDLMFEPQGELFFA